MTLVSLRIELPSHSHSFSVSVPEYADVRAIKQQILINCPGNPRPEGQRLIWRGRILSDSDTVAQLKDAPTVHLAVSPSAWSAQPPSSSTTIPTTHVGAPIPTPTTQPAPSRVVSGSPHLPPMLFQGRNEPSVAAQAPLVYIRYQHQNAILALLGDTNGAFRFTDPPLYVTSKIQTKAYLQTLGYEWPTIFDEPYPERTPGGVKYAFTVIDGQTYLSLQDGSVEPTPFQVHALKVLTHTFPLLSIPSPPSSTMQSYASITRTPITQVPPQVNQLLQQLGLPAQRPINPNPNLPFQLPQQNPPPFPFRPLILPLFFLVLRTLLLLYLFAPARQPVFMMLFVGWMIYEGYRAVQAVFGTLEGAVPRDGAQNPQDAVQQGAGPAAPAAPAAQVAQPQPQPRPALNRMVTPTVNRQAVELFENVSLVNIAQEDAVLDATPDETRPPPPAPTLGHRISSFFTLFVVTFHPAVWNRRRAALRAREGRIRGQAAIRNAQPPTAENESGEANQDAIAERERLRQQLVQEHARRPAWVREYIQRVVAGEWVDEAD